MTTTTMIRSILSRREDNERSNDDNSNRWESIIIDDITLCYYRKKEKREKEIRWVEMRSNVQCSAHGGGLLISLDTFCPHHLGLSVTFPLWKLPRQPLMHFRRPVDGSVRDISVTKSNFFFRRRKHYLKKWCTRYRHHQLGSKFKRWNYPKMTTFLFLCAHF